jgi:hypothetical protein
LQIFSPRCLHHQRLTTHDSRLTTLLAACLAVTVLIGAVSLPVAAQAASCEIPATAPEPAAATVAGDDLTPAAGPAVIQIEEEGGVTATTVSVPATPAATPVPLAPDPLLTLTSELTAVSEALAACLTAGDAEMVAQLAGERYLGQLFGSSVPLTAEDYLAITAELTPIPTRIVSVTDVARPDPDRAVATVTQVVAHQLMQAEWTFEQVPSGERPAGSSAWRLAGERRLPTPPLPEAAVIEVDIGDRWFALNETTVAGPDVVLRGRNTVDEDHEMFVVRLAPGYTTADLLRAAGPDLPAEAVFIGELPIPAGGDGDLVLVDLASGPYTLVCLFPDAQGTPHLAQGMEATFTVE